ncbi:penicillin-binding protein activator LpoB [Oleiphilus sp. HI0125]|nr:penicillin-binding protein activator LpoB [Oleiphilus sp. HI0066]KZY67500.1 penicillin-binding protein activator LpoB [Oleiphilus sp. HI0067]KZZ59994.1 penicillin-binding protein activator LpoB [Oleiphilus sp. HI0125]
MEKIMLKKLNAKPLFLATALLATGIGISGCSEKIAYGDATATETTTIGFGSTDLQSIATKMVDDVLASPFVAEVSKQGRPVAFVDKIKNKTTEHIDTESITDSIQTKLLQSGKFRFVDMTAVEQVKKQLNYQQESGLVDPAKAVALGKQTGAQYMLYGNLSSIQKRNDDKKDVYYKFTMKVLNLETAELEWASEKEIRKTGEKTFLAL